ncbi:hypothetical protein [Vallitalea okinawensis]|uniref:hypothetical protein n=1 Tax=Vallitalea okinawensis TaxID=2078660 RepID=UPI000CFB1D84|nr:hypothetical protein [Vallitalea okinawensis]
MRNLLLISCLIVLLMILSSCRYDNSDKAELESSETVLIQNETIEEKLIDIQIEKKSLSRDLDSLLEEEDITLMIKEDDFLYMSATKDFTSMILAILKGKRQPVYKDKNLNQHHLKLKFDGYEEIYVNLDYNSFWFKGESELYNLPWRLDEPFRQQWDRVIIKVINNKAHYDSFEKTIIQQNQSVDLDYDGQSDPIILYYDGRVRLRVGKEVETMTEWLAENKIRADDDGNRYNGMFKTIVSENGRGLLYVDGPMEWNQSYRLQYYTYDQNDGLERVWDGDEPDENKVVNYDGDTIAIAFNNGDLQMEINLTDEEKAEVDDYIEYHKENGLDLLTDDWLHNKGGIRGYNIIDIDDDGEEELISYKYMVSGAIGLSCQLLSVYGFTNEELILENVIANPDMDFVEECLSQHIYNHSIQVN